MGRGKQNQNNVRTFFYSLQLLYSIIYTSYIVSMIYVTEVH